MILYPEQLWFALQIRGVPDVMIELVRSFHDGMSVTVTARGGSSEPLSVCNGLCHSVLLLLLCLSCTLVL